ncbi:hypothetical protein As57867_002683, partial [Aphanomyces stellatus]
HKVSLHRQGQPIRVLVDGYIPCFVGGGPVLMKCLEGAAWPLLLQKAYAKLHGGYSQVLSIPVSQILEECFGYPRIEFGRIPGGDGLELAHRMRVVLQFGHMVYVTLNINNKSTHDTVVLRVDVDASNLPTAVVVRDMDGRQMITFSFAEFLANLDQASYIPLMPNADVLVRRFYVLDSLACESASAATFALSVADAATIIIGFTFENKATEIGFAILRVMDNYRLHEISSVQRRHKSSCCDLVRLDAGEYIIALKPARVSDDNETSSKPAQWSPEEKMQHFFKQLDWDMDGRLNAEDMGRFMTLYEGGLSFSPSAYYWLLEHFDSDASGLTELGLLQYYQSNTNILANEHLPDDFTAPQFQHARQCIGYFRSTKKIFLEQVNPN